MPVVYETIAELDENGQFRIDLENFSFEKGTQFSVRLTPLPVCIKSEKKRKLLRKGSRKPFKPFRAVTMKGEGLTASEMVIFDRI
ncbi:MAG: hypothetical protein GY795_42745 [Desulfobacterales bacterium]|nr:hypothetical protein [Desulfobacterales bacterium]